MDWTQPELIEVDLNAEIGGYAPDDKPRSDDVTIPTSRIDVQLRPRHERAAEPGFGGHLEPISPAA
jgi:hypothetical protein